MALDLGDKRIGVALSDPTRSIASGLCVVKRTSRQADFDKIGRLALENDVVEIIVGLPTLPSGGEGSRAKWTRDYAADLAKATGITVRLWDESLTSVDASESLRDRGVGTRRRRDNIDSVAAAFILQSYLDFLREKEKH